MQELVVMLVMSAVSTVTMMSNTRFKVFFVLSFINSLILRG